ncbi:protein kinase domain-containing protein [Spirillospora sp. CA-255316]
MPEDRPEAQPLQAQDPRRLGAYELVGRLGSGGQGTVFLGTGPGGERVAVKLLRVRFDDDDTARARFIRETAVARQVARFCTAQVLDADVAGDNPYLVSEYVPGPSLGRQVTREGPITGGALERLAVNTASALAAIHRAGIVHRDLKPHNVLLGPDGARVIDFGLSRVLDAASAISSRPVGTPAYMAPEQVTGENVGAPADVFAWGATMTFAATGHPPFGSDSITAVIYRVLHHEPDLGGLEGDLRDLVAAALDKDPAKRPTAAQVLLRLVGHDEAFAPASAPPDEGEEEGTAVAVTAADPPKAPTSQDSSEAPGETTGETTEPEATVEGRHRAGGPPAAGTRPGGAAPPGRSRGRRRRRRGIPAKVPAALAALGIAAAAGGGTYALMSSTADDTGRGATVAGPSGASPAGSASTAPGAGGSRPAGDPTRTREPEPAPEGTGPRPSRSGGSGPAPTGGNDGGGDDPPGQSDPPPSPVVLGTPDPQRYCQAQGRFRADFRSGRWYCATDGGIGVDSPITMTQVCRSQYAPDAESRLNGDAGVPSDWDCYVLKSP